jgi:Phage integrase, N-terminal SAM-like domain
MAVKIKERGGKWWLYVYWHGQRKKKCIGSKEAAEKARVMLEARLTFANVIFEPVNKPEPPPAPLLFGDYFKRWLETYAKLACKESTWKAYRRDFALYLEPALGSTPLAEISREGVKALLQAIAPATIPDAPGRTPRAPNAPKAPDRSDENPVSAREKNGGAWTRTTDLGIMRPSL